MDEQTKQPLIIGGVAASASFLLLLLVYYVVSIFRARPATFSGVLMVLGVGVVIGAIAGGIAFVKMRD